MPEPWTFEAAAYELPEIWEAEWFPPEDHERVEAVAARLPAGTRSVLDVGCGNGLFLNHLRHSGRPFERLAGVDRSAAALAHVRVPACRSHVAHLPFADATFDTVCSLEVLEHLPDDAFTAALAELARVAARTLVITVPYREDLQSGMCTCPGCGTSFHPDLHVRAFDEQGLARLFDPYGFRAASVERLGRIEEYVDRLVRLRLRGPLRRDEVPPGYAVCPACGHYDPAALRAELADRAARMVGDARLKPSRSANSAPSRSANSAPSRSADSPPSRSADSAPSRAGSGWARLLTRVRPRVARYRWLCVVFTRERAA